MRRSKLSDHTFQKGKFITPINAIPLMHELEDEKSWTYGRMPEYLWIGLILKYYGRDEGLRKSYGIISALHKLAPGLYTARLSQILKLDADIQKRFYDYIICSGAKEALAPLTVFLTASKAPVFAECFYCPDQSIEDRCEVMIQTMREIMDHQSNEATDSSFEHGLWGAIRESSLLKCNNPAHKYHCVPDVEDEARLKTVLPDCIMIMNKTISFLDEIYGIPEQLLNEVINFEIKPIAG